MLALYRSSLILSGECNLNTACISQVELVLGLISLYIGLEMLITPKSAAMYVLYNSILPGRMPLIFARLIGAIYVGIGVVIVYSRIQQLLGGYP